MNMVTIKVCHTCLKSIIIMITHYNNEDIYLNKTNRQKHRTDPAWNIIPWLN